MTSGLGFDSYVAHGSDLEPELLLDWPAPILFRLQPYTSQLQECRFLLSRGARG